VALIPTSVSLSFSEVPRRGAESGNEVTLGETSVFNSEVKTFSDEYANQVQAPRIEKHPGRAMARAGQFFQTSPIWHALELREQPEPDDLRS
jgi:hypothetical protein